MVLEFLQLMEYQIYQLMVPILVLILELEPTVWEGEDGVIQYKVLMQDLSMCHKMKATRKSIHRNY